MFNKYFKYFRHCGVICKILLIWRWQVKFHIKDMIFRIHDVGGQRSERRKWLYLFDCVHAVCLCLCLWLCTCGLSLSLSLTVYTKFVFGISQSILIRDTQLALHHCLINQSIINRPPDDHHNYRWYSMWLWPAITTTIPILHLLLIILLLLLYLLHLFLLYLVIMTIIFQRLSSACLWPATVTVDPREQSRTRCMRR